MANNSVEKVCSKCKEVKLVSEFYPSKQNKTGYLGACKQCTLSRQREYVQNIMPEQKRRRGKENHLWTRYKMRVEEYDAMFEQQEGRCALCRKPPYDNHALEVDHCHETGKIRGLLCIICNCGLGKLGDTIESIQRVLEYLRNVDNVQQPCKIKKEQPRGMQHHWNTNPERRMSGEKHGLAVFTEDEVREFRRRYGAKEATSTDMAKEVGVHKSTMQAITSRRNWKHVE